MEAIKWLHIQVIMFQKSKKVKLGNLKLHTVTVLVFLVFEIYNHFRDSESLGKNNGKKWSNI